MNLNKILSNTQMNFLEEQLHFPVSKKMYSLDEIVNIVDQLTDYLTSHGYNKDYSTNENGTIAEDIITVITTNPKW